MEQCRELDIAIALAPNGVNGVAAAMRRPPALSGVAGGDKSRPSTPSVGSLTSSNPSSVNMSAIEKLGKELNKSLLNLVNVRICSRRQQIAA